MIVKPDEIEAGALSSRQKGFTIVELMIVVAIVSILAMIAMPVYLNYTIRSKVTEALGFMGEAKTTVSDKYYSDYEMPNSNEGAGLSDPNSYNFYQYIQKLQVGEFSGDPNGIITATLKLPGTSSDGKKLQLVPTVIDGEVGWTCRPAPVGGIQTSRVPANCRE